MYEEDSMKTIITNEDAIFNWEVDKEQKNLSQ